MNQIKSIHWDFNKNKEILEQILDYQKESNELVPFGYKKENFNTLKLETKKLIEDKFQISLKDKLIISNGHQPEIHHPGILFKDIITSLIAKKLNQVAIHIIVDTDAFEFQIPFPQKRKDFLVLEQIHFKSNEIFSSYKLNEENKNQILDSMKTLRNELDLFIPEIYIKTSYEYIDLIIKEIEKENSITEISFLIREKFFKENEISILQINISELLNLNSFKSLVYLIKNNFKEFREAYNSSLLDYRKEHKIKNHAQPIPDLGEDELPFWILNPSSNERVPLKFNDQIEDKKILPKAITLTMFLRLFLSDFFIHGKGGGRYEEVSEKIYERFFKIKASPYSVASITYNLNPTEKFSFVNLDEKILEQNLRDIEYSPEKFLPVENEFSKQKKLIQNEFKNPESNKKELHKKIEELNSEMRILLKEKKLELEKTKSILPEILKTKEVFQTRNLPFYLYDLNEMLNLEFKDF